MRMFDGEHDIAAKTISFPGMAPLDLPARTGTTTTSQTGGDADLTAFLDHLATHPNTAPFISRLLIQRLVTSNPTPAYVGRVSSAFTTSGGDLKAVIRAILLDSEARDYSRLAGSRPRSRPRALHPLHRHGPRLRSRAPPDPSAGRTLPRIRQVWMEISCSVRSALRVSSISIRRKTNPPVPLRDNGLTSPEMQITNSVTSITGPNRLFLPRSVSRTPRLNTSTIPDERRLDPAQHQPTK